MKSEKIMPGVILVLLGTVFLLDNYNVIDFHWANIWRFWPVFLIMGGINLVFAHNKSAWATILKVSVVVLGFGLLVFVHTPNRYFFPHYNFNYNDDNSDNDDDDNYSNEAVPTPSLIHQPLHLPGST
jgi:hypothetical protein